MEAKAKLALANENLASLEGIVRLNESRVNAGATAPVELTRSRVAMLQFRGSVQDRRAGADHGAHPAADAARPRRRASRWSMSPAR